MPLIPQHHRRLMPPLSAWVAFIVFGLLGETPALVIGFWLGHWSLIIGRGMAAASVLAGVLYAVWRVVGFHPLVRPPYRMWLRSSPWQPGEKLPLGPVGLTLTDLVIVVLIAIPGLFSELPGAAVIAFLVAWVIGNVMVFCALGMIRSSCGFIILLGAVPVVAVVALLSASDEASADSLAVGFSVFAVLVAAAVTNFCLPRSLVVMDRRSWMEEETDEADVFKKKAGWPVIDLASTWPGGLPFGKPEMVLVSLTLGWLCYSGALFARYSPYEDGPFSDHAIQWMTLLLSIVVGMLRLAVYLARTRPPISLWGRVVVGPLIQWKYDRVFVTPLLGVFVSYALLIIGFVEIVPVELAFGLAVTSVTLINGLGGPDMATFRLLGTQRLSPPAFQTVESVTLTSSQTKAARV